MRTSRNNQCNLDMQCSSTWTQLPVSHLAHFLHVFFHRQSLYSCHVPNLDRRGCVTRSLSVSVYNLCPASKVDIRGCAYTITVRLDLSYLSCTQTGQTCLCYTITVRLDLSYLSCTQTGQTWLCYTIAVRLDLSYLSCTQSGQTWLTVRTHSPCVVCSWQIGDILIDIDTVHINNLTGITTINVFGEFITFCCDTTIERRFCEWVAVAAMLFSAMPLDVV